MPTALAGDEDGYRPGALGWWARRMPQFAATGLAVVLLGLSGFALWASQYTGRLTDQAVAASKLSTDYGDATRAVALEESLERKYRLEPGPEVLASYSKASSDLVAALSQVRLDGGPAEVDQAAALLQLHVPYLGAIHRMFAAVDRSDAAQVLAIDAAEVDPLFSSIEKTTETAALLHEIRSVRALASLGRIQHFTSVATPLVFLTGLLVMAFLLLVLRRVRLQLDHQSDRAIHNSLHDALTGLPNRLLLSERFSQALKTGSRDNHVSGLLLMDLDHFKEVNDTLGHHYGDGLLEQIGPRLTRVLREFDTVARLGGDEFAILLPVVKNLAEAISVAERINGALSAPFNVHGVALSVEASIGVVVSGIHGDTPAVLLQHADVAMYVAKEQSIGIFGYRPELDDHSPERLRLVGDLRSGLEHHEFILHYQPQMSITTGEICGVEALVRWQHPSRGLIQPDDFIMLAEHTAMIGPLTVQILDIALSQSRSWLEGGFRIPISVNLSARNLLDHHFSRIILASLRSHGVPPDLLCVEVTETAIMSEPVRSRQVLSDLHHHGVRISIDDFGAGYTSLAQLKNLPVTELKIDRSFVTGMDQDPTNALIVRSVIDLGHNLGLTVVAEGVETASVQRFLTDHGCDVVQGYHIARPMGAAALLEFYRQTPTQRLLVSGAPSLPDLPPVSP